MQHSLRHVPKRPEEILQVPGKPPRGHVVHCEDGDASPADGKDTPRRSHCRRRGWLLTKEGPALQLLAPPVQLNVQRPASTVGQADLIQKPRLIASRACRLRGEPTSAGD